MKNKPSQKQKLPVEEVRGGIFFDSNPLPMWVYDLETYRFLAVNHAAVAHYGYSETDFLAMTIKDIRPPEDVSRLVENVEHVTEGLDEAGIWRHTRKDGSLIYVEIVSHTMQYEGRAAELVVAMDVTERRRAEEAVRASEQKFRYIVEDIRELICRFLPDGTLTYVNDAYCRYRGKSREELIGSNFISDADDDFPQKLRAYFDSFTPDHPVSTFEQYDLLPNGDKRWREWMDRAIFRRDGQLIEFQSTGRDITDRKRAEQSLRESEDRFRRLAENAPDLIYRYEFAPKRGFVYVSPAATSITGFTPEEHYADPDLGFKLVHPEDRHLLEEAARGQIVPGQPLVLRWVRKDGSILWTEQRNIPVFNDAGEMIALEGIARDVTERKQAEQALEQSQAQLQGIIHSAMDAIITIDEEQRILLFNPAAERMYKCATADAIGQPLTRFMPEYVRDLHEEYVHAFGRSNASKRSMESPALELTCERADSEMFPSEVSISQLELDGRKLYTAIVRDISERKQADDQLRKSEERFRSLIKNGRDNISLLAADGTLLWESPSVFSTLGYAPGQFTGRSIFELMHPDDLPWTQALFAHVVQTPGDGKDGLFRLRHNDDSWRWIEATATNLLAEPSVQAIVINYRDVTVRMQSEESLRKSEDRYRDLVENIHDLIGTHDLQGNILSINPAASKLLGIEHETLLTMNLRDLLVPEARDQFEDYLAAIQRDGQASGLMLAQTKNGERRIWEYDNTLRSDSVGASIVRALARDVTEQKQAEDALRENEARYRGIFDGVQEAIFVESPDGAILDVNESACRMFGWAREEFLKKKVADLIPQGRVALMLDENGYGNLSERFVETVNRRANGEEFPIEISGRMHPLNGRPTLLVVARDISERKQAEEKIRRQIDYLTALREIDRAIASTFDMRLSLDSLLAKALSLLAVDAAAILLVNTTLNTLNYAAGRGFHTRAAATAQVKLGESYAGRAAMERRLIQIPNLADEPDNPLLIELLGGEHFVSYHGVPLIVKGKVIGVLEVFHRAFVKRDREWHDFLDTLAGQAAIAIDNAQLFEGMQASNIELVLAYDATIEGWSRAMDLRDKETEGHTQRVTDLTLKLAREMGIPQPELIHIRRGALLHDIGKLGVPDSILLKPGKLTDEEWDIMRRHPVFAYEMLLPIKYLKPALDIPYCHHEKWDGTGYPCGLREEQIPLAARIFAVVDVWDALRSDRPYRPAWSKERTLEHILSLKGSHFDPEVVEAFMNAFATAGDGR